MCVYIDRERETYKQRYIDMCVFIYIYVCMYVGIEYVYMCIYIIHNT